MIDSFSISSSLVIWIAGALVVLLLIGWIKWIVGRRRKFDLAKITMRDIDKMDGHEFEDYLYVLISALEYEQVYQTKKSRDYGADLLYEQQDGTKCVVQAKRYREKLGLSAVQEVYAAKAFYGAERALIITTADKLSDSCLKLAAATDVHIVDRLDLDAVIKAFKKGRYAEAWEVLDVSLEPVAYSSTNSLEKPPEVRGAIQAGEYFYKQ
ncbi:restriction endonuclease [Alkalihalophilus marmarensis]|uniref:Restriction endonuclease type IV Mrr domain-containing protein n=1 Tax=Alkalihalophilus marmarensis DSM 21297 TaxID=1188261 RepID=U6SL25_9BACI|nr:restriction endonuclease [Alkalihalophilus marmarensis]ERN52409.1 hypothetical protein A33I_16650 [Alkalihalophilus marmarensis DSM 21297]